jgi:N-acetylneuraminic acid mutarotase
MAVARARHTATLLPSGKVLVIGGFDGARFLSSAEIYDPARDTWSLAHPMSATRAGHTATLLPSGKVLVTGGYNGSTLKTASIYDPTRDSWTSARPMSTARTRQTATLLQNGMVLVTGGNDGTADLASAEIYDPSVDKWAPAPSMSTVRDAHTATVLANGEVLVAGGRQGAGGVVSSAEIYNPGTGMWKAAGAMRTPREFHTATLLASGKVLVTGGTYAIGAETYDPARDTWTSTLGNFVGRYHHTATLLPSGGVLVAGGYHSPSDVDTAAIYDPARDDWTPARPLGAPREGHTATLLPGGSVLVVGGRTDNVFLASSEIYTAQSQSVPDPPTRVRARVGVRSATVWFTPPADDGRSPITSYEITSSPIGPAVTVPGRTTTAVVRGLRPGTRYTFTVTATNALGVSAPSAPSNPVLTPTPPPIGRIRNLKISPATITPADRGPSIVRSRRGKSGAIVSYTNTAASTTRFTVEIRTAGRLQGGRCVSPTVARRGSRRCTRYTHLGSFTHQDRAGTNRFTFTGRVRGRKLVVGRYRLRAIPRNAAGSGAAAYRRFAVRR